MPRTVPDVVPAGRMNSNGQPSLNAGPDLILRPWLRSDAAALVAAFTDAAIQRWHTRLFSSEEEAEAWVDRWGELWNAETDASWVVTSTATGELNGYVALRAVDLESGSAHVAYWVVEAARGHGVASTAAEAISRWAFEDLGLHRLELRHAVANVPSCSVASKLGFALEGTARSAELLSDGWHDEHLHARINPMPIP
jgi:RimJ/RimL family protein N-acetyltransferase